MCFSSAAEKPTASGTWPFGLMCSTGEPLGSSMGRPPRHDIVEVCPLRRGLDEEHLTSGGPPALGTNLRRLLAPAVAIVIDRDPKHLDAAQHGEVLDTAGRDE